MDRWSSVKLWLLVKIWLNHIWIIFRIILYNVLQENTLLYHFSVQKNVVIKFHIQISRKKNTAKKRPDWYVFSQQIVSIRARVVALSIQSNCYNFLFVKTFFCILQNFRNIMFNRNVLFWKKWEENCSSYKNGIHTVY